MKIAQIAPLWYAIPPEKYGGIERIVHFLTEGLVKKGHEVVLFASGDSKTKAKLSSIRKNHLAKDKMPWTDIFWELENLSFAFKKAKDFDLVHCHVGLRALFFQEFSKTPCLHTFHNPVLGKKKGTAPSLEILELHKKTTRACFISKAAQELCPVKIEKSWVVYNGIDLKIFPFSPEPKNYFLWAGRMDPYKGVENAIQAAKETGTVLYLAGKIDEKQKAYFKNKIKPQLSSNIQYLGELHQEELSKAYQGAKGFLYPIEWEEPFGLVMIEAMACGTPVIAFERGSVRELVKNDQNGFSVPFLNKEGKKNIEGLKKAMEKIETIKREDCRKWVQDNFTVEKMVTNYEKIYNETAK